MTEELWVPMKLAICECCLSKVENIVLKEYAVKSEELKSILKVDTLNLCETCTLLAQGADTFVSNVNKGKDAISSLYNSPVKHESDKYVKCEIQMQDDNVKRESTLDKDDCSASDTQDDTEMIYGTELDIELKVEDTASEDVSELLYCTNLNDDFKSEDCKKTRNMQNSTQDVSEMFDGAELSNDFKSEDCNENTDNQNDSMVEIVYLNSKELDNIRAAMLEDANFLNAKFKCYDCIKFYAHEETFDKHMKTHSEACGRYTCEICKQRMRTKDRYIAHKKNHFRWYKCTLCDVMRLTRDVIKNHYAVSHTNLKNDCYCLLCDKWFKNARALRKHKWYKHSGVKGIKCAFCDKELADRKCLRTHIMSKHPENATEPLPTNDFVCECGKEFPTRGRLKAHSLVHKSTKEFYCVECDKAFKSRSMLQAHLKSAIHTKYNEYKHVCEKCNKRFITQRSLESHVNKEHLKIRPHQCKECDKAFFLVYRLRQHVRQVHEGRKPPLAIPCQICHKLFRTNNTLKEHVRTHTGERPYECKICGSKFTQSGILRTHQKIVHFKINRKTRLGDIDSKLL